MKIQQITKRSNCMSFGVNLLMWLEKRVKLDFQNKIFYQILENAFYRVLYYLVIKIIFEDRSSGSNVFVWKFSLQKPKNKSVLFEFYLVLFITTLCLSRKKHVWRNTSFWKWGPIGLRISSIWRCHLAYDSFFILVFRISV